MNDDDGGFAGLLPATVSTVFDRGAGALGSPFPEEESAIGRAVPRRRDEFIATRVCAREALAGIGVAPVAIPVGSTREPLWPEGVVGSLTHCVGYRAAAVARASELLGLGIDVEIHRALPDGVREQVTVPDERDELHRLAADGVRGVHWDCLLFSAKESIYKLWFPLTGRWLGFGDCRMSFALDSNATGGAPRGTFIAEVLVDRPAFWPDRVLGHWALGGQFVKTAVSLQQSD